MYVCNFLFHCYSKWALTFFLFIPIRKKIIGLDDLLTDHYKDKCKLVEKESKLAKKRKNYDSDDDDFGKEAVVSQVVDECQNKVKYVHRGI